MKSVEQLQAEIDELTSLPGVQLVRALHDFAATCIGKHPTGTIITMSILEPNGSKRTGSYTLRDDDLSANEPGQAA